MSWSILREFFRAAVLTVEPNWNEWRDAYNFNNIPAASLNNRFHIEIGPFASIGRDDQAFTDNTTVVIRIHRKTGKDNIDEFDSLLTTAYNIRKACCSLIKLNESENITNIIMDSMVPEFIDTNDNALRFTLSFSVDMKFKDIY